MATLAAALAEPVALRGERVRVGASIGAAVTPARRRAGFEALLHTADQRMYTVKGGRLVSP